MCIAFRILKRVGVEQPEAVHSQKQLAARLVGVISVNCLMYTCIEALNW